MINVEILVEGQDSLGVAQWECVPDVGERLTIGTDNYIVTYRGWGVGFAGNGQLLRGDQCVSLELRPEHAACPKCATCKHFGGQGCVGLKHEAGEWRYCAAFLYGDYSKDIEPMPEYRVTWGNTNGAKGQLFVHQDFCCINHNPVFDEEKA